MTTTARGDVVKVVAPRIAASRAAISSSRPRLPRGFVFWSRRCATEAAACGSGAVIRAARAFQCILTSLDAQRLAGDQQEHIVGDRRHALIQEAGRIAKR